MYLMGFSVGVFGEEALVDDARGRSNLGELGGVYSDFVDYVVEVDVTSFLIVENGVHLGTPY